MTSTDSRTPSALTLSDLNTTVNHEPRVSHVRLAEVLGYQQSVKLRHLVERNRAELERYGQVSSTVDETPSAKGGRPGTVYWLNEAQALLACIRSDAPNAPDARQMLIEIYMAWRRGQPSSDPVHLPPFCTGCRAREMWERPMPLRGVTIEERRAEHPLSDGPITGWELAQIVHWRAQIAHATKHLREENDRLKEDVAALNGIRKLLGMDRNVIATRRIGQ